MCFERFRYYCPAIASVALIFALGCGESTNGDSTVAGPTANDGIVDLQAMLKELAAANQPLPKNLAEMAPHDPIHPVAAAFLQNGSLVYYWGNPIRSDGSAAKDLVIAHESKTATEGGWVLLQDGNVKQMTADEFKAAAKPPQ